VQVRLAARLSGFRRPTLWLNDVTYAPLIAATGWPSLYDITDDWLLAPASERELERLRRLDELALQRADEVVVCSTALAESRGARRAVRLIPNAVDSEHFREPRPRPSDLPGPPVAVYAGSLHEARLDVALIRDVANALPHVAIALVGPDALEPSSRRALTELPNIRLLGAKPYRDVPAYLQHANVLIVPHRVTPFTDSLDPIKAYECVAVSKPTVATPVAGFRELHPMVTLASGDEFAQAVAGALRSAAPVGLASALPSWEERAQEFEQVLRQCRPPRPR
jgi:teichuronic acid biosynthesis glycosyltransferase TuaH